MNRNPLFIALAYGILATPISEPYDKPKVKKAKIKSRFTCKSCQYLSLNNYCSVKQTYMKHKNMACDKINQIP